MEDSSNFDTSKKDTSQTFILPKKIAVLYTDAKREYFQTEALYITEKDAEKDAKLTTSYIEKLGIEAVTFSADENLIDNLKKCKPEMVFNLAYSVRGSDYLGATIPAILDYLDIPYTGTDFFGYAFNTDKFLNKKVLQQVGIPVPHFQLFNTPNDQMNLDLRFPLISKLNEIHCAVEITKDAVSENEKHLRERLKYLISTYKQPVLVEEFIAGREITAVLLEGLNKKVYTAEKVFVNTTDKYVFTTFEDQWINETATIFKYEKYEDPYLKEHVKKAFEVTKMVDYGKFDIRLDISGRYYFIDMNANPAFGPKEMEVASSTILDMYGVTFTEILRRLIVNTMKDPSFESGNGSGNGNGNYHNNENEINGHAYPAQD